MSLAQWTEPKPCALSRPRFIRIKVRDARGIPTGETYVKRVGRPSCASGEAAVSSHTVNGVVHHLCIGCSRDDLLMALGETDESPLPTEYAAPPLAKEDENTILVRTTADTAKHCRALERAGWRAKPRTRLVQVPGFRDCRVSVWVRA